ncbi:MAG: hypothetical protein GWN16_07800 [Calditrichae bacterium]|nr:hypothetical protein [Calditrichia bacterium]
MGFHTRTIKNMKWFSREQLQPGEPTMAQEAEEVMKQTVEEGYKTTPEGEEARKYLEKWPEDAPHRKAIETMAYRAIPEFVHDHTEYGLEPEVLIKNPEFNEIRTKLAKSFGVAGATVPISDSDVKRAIALAKEYLANQVEGLETGEEDVAAA